MAIDYLIKANEYAVRSGKNHMVARHEKEIAEMFEQRLDRHEDAIKYYLSAAERYEIDDSFAIAQGCSIQAAQLAAKIGENEKAAELFENNAEACASDTMRRYSAKDYLFRAGLCRLLLDVNAERGVIALNDLID